jgi:hypothetical protein
MMSEKQQVYPSHFVTAEKKASKEWCMDYIKAMYYEFTRKDYGFGYNQRDRYKENRLYAHGLQSVNQYKELLTNSDDPKDTFINLNWEIHKKAPKYRDTILGRMDKIEYLISANAIDQLAVDAKRQYKFRKRAEILLSDLLSELQSLSGMPQTPEQQEMPKDMEGLELWLELNYKHALELAIEQGLDVVFYINKFRHILSEMRKDLVDFGVMACKDLIDSNGMVKIRHSDPSRLITSYCKKADFSDITHAGEVISITISDLRQLAGDAFSDQDYEQMARQACGKHGNPSGWQADRLQDGRMPYDDFTLLMVDAEWFSTSKLTYQKITTKYGNTTLKKRSDEFRFKEKDSFSRTHYKVVYKGCWIVDTDYCFNYGLASDMKRVKSNLADTSLSYHIFAPHMVEMRTVSMMDRMRTVLDQIQLTWLKLQDAIASARKKGLAINLDGLDDISYGGKEGEVFKPLQVVEIYNQTGNLLYRTSGVSGLEHTGLPVQELENGMASDVFRFVELMNFYRGELQDVLGVNDVFDASNPNPEVGLGTSKLAMEAANNALQPLYTVDRMLYEQLCKSCVLRLQEAVKIAPIRGIAEVMGREKAEVIEINSDIALHEYVLKIETKPDDYQRQLLEQNLQACLAEQSIDIEDAIYIRRINNLKLAEKYLVYKRKKRAELAAQQAQQQTEMASQQQQESAAMSAQMEQQRMQMEFEMTLQKEQALSQLRLQEELVKHRYRMAELEMQGAIKAEHIDLTGDIDMEIKQKEGEQKLEQIKATPKPTVAPKKKAA